MPFGRAGLSPLPRPGLFTQVRRIVILRTSPFGHSRKLDFHFTEFSEVGQGFIGDSSPSASVAESADLGGADHPALSRGGSVHETTYLVGCSGGGDGGAGSC